MPTLKVKTATGWQEIRNINDITQAFADARYALKEDAASVEVSTTAPTGPQVGDLWYDPNGTTLSALTASSPTFTNVADAVERVDPTVIGASGQYLGVGPSGPIWRSESWFDVSHPRFGATVGSTDNIAAINAATEAANTAGGGTVYIPNGTWTVRPSGTTSWIKLYTNVRLLLAPNAILKVANDNGDFQTLIGGWTFNGFIKNVTIEGGTIDLNPTGNTTGTVANLSGRTQNAVLSYNFDGITIKNVRFDACCGQNTIMLSGDGCKNAKVIDCYFRYVRRGATNYDNSAIYIEAVGHEVRGNRGEAAISEAAYGFIETHNGQSVISGNRSKGFRTGVNIVGGSFADALLVSNDIAVEGNDFSDAQRAIVLWPVANGVRNVSIRGNTISLAQVQHNTTTCCGVGIETSAGMTGELVNIGIEGNAITFEDDARTTAAASAALSGYFMGGILIGGRGPIRNVTIHNNPIHNSPSIGIRVGDTDHLAEVSNVDVSGNALRNCGRNANITSSYRIPLFVDGTLTNVHVHDNPIRDTGSPSAYAGNSIRANFTLDAVSNVFVYNNPVSSVSALAATIDRTKIGDYTASVALDFPSIAAGADQTLTVTLLGAATTDVAYASPTAALPSGVVIKQVWVSAANTVSVTLTNFSAAPIDPASQTWIVGIRKRTV